MPLLQASTSGKLSPAPDSALETAATKLPLPAKTKPKAGDLGQDTAKDTAKDAAASGCLGSSSGSKPRGGGGGLSCLKPATLDEDSEPLTRSPEKKVMSPSGKSISDIFGKVRM